MSRLLGRVAIVTGAASDPGLGRAVGIRCNSVHPGFIWTNMQAQAMGTRDRAGAQIGRFVPIDRLGEPQDVAECVVYLASADSKYVTGAEFVIDGAMTAQ